MGLLITACTNRKRVAPPQALRANTLDRGPLDVVAADWLRRLSEVEDRTLAKRLYAGRGFVEASHAAAQLGEEFAIVSAGLGLVKSNTLVPAYGLSVAEGSPDSILPKIGRNEGPAWWVEISRRSPFSTSLATLLRGTTGIVVLALSDAYLGLIGPAFVQVDEASRERFRLITRTPPARIIPELRPYLLPYDDRLDGPDSPIRGTRGDFASRGARHFVETILRMFPDGTVADHAAAVRDCIAPWRQPAQLERTRHDDETLLALIRKHWDAAGGQSSRLLRILRDDLNVACEQGRFVGLMQRLRQERALAI